MSHWEMENQSLDTKRNCYCFQISEVFKEGGVRLSLPLPLLRKWWYIAQVAVVNSRGELICFYTLSLFVFLPFTPFTPLVMQQLKYFHSNHLSFLVKYLVGIAIQYQYQTDRVQLFLVACYAVRHHQVTREKKEKTTSLDNCVGDWLSSRCCGDDLHRQGNTGHSVRQKKNSGT